MAKKISMQEEADRLFETEMKLAPKTKHSDRALIACFLGFLTVFGILLFALPPKTFSEQENRELQTFPALSTKSEMTFGEKLSETVSAIFNTEKSDKPLKERLEKTHLIDRYLTGKFSADFGEFCADQFPLRDFFVGVEGLSEIALFKGENNGVMLGRDGTLITRMRGVGTVLSDGTAYVTSNVNSISDFAARMKAENIPLTFACAGRTADIETEKYPALYDPSETEAPWKLLSEALPADGTLSYLDLRPVIKEKSDAGEDVMYRTDHHWTTLGAYYAYCEILRSWDMEPLPLDFFTRETASEEFFGTAWRTAGMKWVKPDTMEFFRYPGDEDFTVTITGEKEPMRGFYDRAYLSKTDKYSAFLSGNRSYESVTKNTEEPREKLLLVKDSFGHCIAPFLAYHFDLEIVDLRYYKGSTAALARETGCGRALVLCNMASLTDTVSFSLLAME